ncbi:MAG: sigma-E processing peptidase SpoIIGA [Flavonifractor plautii]
MLALLAGYGKSRRLLRVSLVFFAVSAAFGGGVFALQLLGGRGLTLQNGIFYSAMDLRLILLSAAGCYVLITLLFQRTARHSGLRRELVPAVLTLEGRRVALTALVDTGNTLTDPATGRPVMVAEGEKVGALFPDGQAPAPEELRRPVEALERLGRQGWQGRCRLLPYQAVGVGAACCWPCAWTGRGWGRRTTASCCWPCPPPASPTGAAITR